MWDPTFLFRRNSKYDGWFAIGFILLAFCILGKSYDRIFVAQILSVAFAVSALRVRGQKHLGILVLGLNLWILIK